MRPVPPVKIVGFKQKSEDGVSISAMVILQDAAGNHVTDRLPTLPMSFRFTIRFKTCRSTLGVSCAVRRLMHILVVGSCAMKQWTREKSCTLQDILQMNLLSKQVRLL